MFAPWEKHMGFIGIKTSVNGYGYRSTLGRYQTAAKVQMDFSIFAMAFNLKKHTCFIVKLSE